MLELTIKEKFNTLTKKQKKQMDYEDYSCEDDMNSHIDMMYEFNQLPLAKRREMIKEAKSFKL